jgi:VanZ family protein
VIVAAVTRFRALLWLLTGAYWLLLLTLTHLPPSHLPETHLSDKFEHFTCYALLAGLLHLCQWPSRKSLWAISLATIAILLAYGAFDELTQPFFHRTCSIYDWYADAAGAVTAVTAMTFARQFAGFAATSA